MIKPDKIVSTVCPYCGVGCNLELHIKDNTIFSVTSPFDSPTNHGNLCVKGRFGYDFLIRFPADNHSSHPEGKANCREAKTGKGYV